MKTCIYRVQKSFIIKNLGGKKAIDIWSGETVRGFRALDGTIYLKGSVFYDYILEKEDSLSELTVDLILAGFIRGEVSKEEQSLICDIVNYKLNAKDKIQKKE